jgi:heterodisulfide reductase subunit A-like polyferredoxin
MQSFKTFTGKHKVWLHHSNGATPWSEHAGTKYGYHEACMEAQAAAIENRCKTSVIHDSFGPLKVFGADGKEYLHESTEQSGHDIFHAAAKEAARIEKQKYKLETQKDVLGQDLYQKWKKNVMGPAPEEHPTIRSLKQKISNLEQEAQPHHKLMDKHFYDRKDDIFVTKSDSKTPLRKWRDDWLTDMENHYQTSSSDRKKIKQELFYRRYY